MNIRGTPDLGQPSDDPSSGGERERIRQRMKMVIGQLEDILRELKEVAKELREVVSQIDKLTSDFDFELEPDDWTTATVSSTSSSDKLEFRRSRQLASLPLAQIREGKETYRIVSISPRKKQTQSQGSLTEPWKFVKPPSPPSSPTFLSPAMSAKETEFPVQAVPSLIPAEGGSFPLWTTIPWCSTSRASYPQTPAHLPFTLPDPASTPKKLLLQWITSPLRAGTIAVLPGADTGLAHKASLQDRGMNSYFLIKESSNSPCSYSINPLEHQPQRQLIH
eukprot:XP_028351624.1 inhibitory synaptic factor 1 isoform X11 [Physeter catodon]